MKVYKRTQEKLNQLESMLVILYSSYNQNDRINGKSMLKTIKKIEKTIDSIKNKTINDNN
jgi:uncharacterized protein Yka (UPF0111/DUF47 family)